MLITINAIQKENKVLKQINKHITVLWTPLFCHSFSLLLVFCWSWPSEESLLFLFANVIFPNTMQINVLTLFDIIFFVGRIFNINILQTWEPKGHLRFCIHRNDSEEGKKNDWNESLLSYALITILIAQQTMAKIIKIMNKIVRKQKQMNFINMHKYRNYSLLNENNQAIHWMWMWSISHLFVNCFKIFHKLK